MLVNDNESNYLQRAFFALLDPVVYQNTSYDGFKEHGLKLFLEYLPNLLELKLMSCPDVHNYIQYIMDSKSTKCLKNI